MPCSLPPSQITAFIARQLGKAQSYVLSQVNREVQKIQDQLSGSICPPAEKLEELLKVRDNLLQVIDGFEKKVLKYKETAEEYKDPIDVAKITVTVLEQLAIPTTVGLPPPTGGVLFSLPVRVTNKFAQLLNLACTTVDTLQDTQNTISSLANNATGFLTPVKEKLNSINLQLEECINKLPPSERQRFANIVRELPPISDGSELYRSKSGNLYYITIVDQKQGSTIAPRRYAEVEDQVGVVVLRGPASFSSSTKVLIDEIKFRIDNQLP